MNLQELLSKTDFLTSIAQYVGLETLAAFASISKSSGKCWTEQKKLMGALSSAIRSVVCADVFSQAIERVENIRMGMKESFVFGILSRKWKDLARVTLRMQTYRLQVGSETRCCSELA